MATASFGDIRDLDEVLVAPELSTSRLEVPRDWRTWDSIFQDVRDTINKLIGLVNKIPEIDLRPLPGGSLADLVVKPFTGDWDRIRGNGSACTIFGTGIQGMASNLTAIPVQMSPHWSGQAASAFFVHHGSYAIVMGAVGELVKRGKIVFDSVGSMSQELGELAIRILVPLGRLLVRLSAKIASRFAGWYGVARTAADIMVDGLDAIRDIYEDLKTVIELVDELFTLKAAVEEWVSTQVERLRMFDDMPSLLDELPAIASGVLADLPTEADDGLQERVDDDVDGIDTSEDDAGGGEALEEVIDGASQTAEGAEEQVG